MSFGEQFLTLPDLFPARAAGETWGDETLAVDFAGGPYRFVGLAAEHAAALGERFAPLVVPAATLDTAAPTTRLFRVAADDFRWFPQRGWQTSFDLAPGESAIGLAGRGFMGRLELPAGDGALWTCFADSAELAGVFENFFRVAVAYRLLAAGGVLLHSAGVVQRGRGFVFFGRSGAGKSTLSGFAEAAGREVLSDELNALWPGEAGARVESLPFAGDYGQRCRPRSSFPLAGLFRLEQGPVNARRALGRVPAVAALATCSPFVNADPWRGEALLANLERLVAARAPEVLTFGLDGRVWDMFAT